MIYTQNGANSGKKIFKNDKVDQRPFRLFIVHGMVQLAITLNFNKTNCCDEWEAKSNQDIRWTTTFQKIQRIKAAKLKWFQIRLVHNISYKCCVNAHGC